MRSVIVAIDQGTTSTRAIVYDLDTFQELGADQLELERYLPQPGWVEHDPLAIWQSVADVVPRALAQARCEPKAIAAIGISNQRETIVLWERDTLRPLGRAIVWQDRRSTDWCANRAADRRWLQDRTGLILDPYFSATKIAWLLDHDPTLRARMAQGHVVCGTIDSWILARLTGGSVFATDVTNASRTLLFNIHKLDWDPELCAYFDVPMNSLAAIHSSAADYGETGTLPFLPAGIPIRSLAGDQQAALFGHGVFGPGSAKCTYGTGAFFLQHTGSSLWPSRHQLLTTVAAMTDATPRYALEGSVFVAGAAVQWLRDGLQLFPRSEDTQTLAEQSNPQEPVIFVPAFVGLGAPYWEPEARGAFFGLTRGTTAADLTRATLESVAYQVNDLIDAARQDIVEPLHFLHVDGGMTSNDWLMQTQADLLGLPVIRADRSEATARGAAFLAGIGIGAWNEQRLSQLVMPGKRFDPALPETVRRKRILEWQTAIHSLISYTHAQSRLL